MPKHETPTTPTPQAADSTTGGGDDTVTVRRPRKGRPTVAELRERTLHTDRAWEIEDVAAFLVCSVREAEDFVKDPTVPQPRVSRGRMRRWSPARWHAWLNEDGELHVPNSTTADDGDEGDGGGFGDI